MKGLEQDWAGLGDPDQTDLDVVESTGEIFILDRRYGLRSHTHTMAMQVDMAKFLSQQRRRLTFLARHFIEIASGAEKIFVLKSAMNPDAVGRILTSLRRYNPKNQLLCVYTSSDKYPVGSLTKLSAGLYVGAISRFSQNDTDFSSWLTICEKMAAAVFQPADSKVAPSLDLGQSVGD